QPSYCWVKIGWAGALGLAAGADASSTFFFFFFTSIDAAGTGLLAPVAAAATVSVFVFVPAVLSARGETLFFGPPYFPVLSTDLSARAGKSVFFFCAFLFPLSGRGLLILRAFFFAGSG